MEPSTEANTFWAGRGQRVKSK